LGIERNKRSPKRRRTIAQRLRGRRIVEWNLPELVEATSSKSEEKPKPRRKKKGEESD